MMWLVISILEGYAHSPRGKDLVDCRHSGWNKRPSVVEILACSIVWVLRRSQSVDYMVRVIARKVSASGMKTRGTCSLSFHL
jgi:hypothetical protein